MAQQKHSPDGNKRGGADASSLGGPLVMQVVSSAKETFMQCNFCNKEITVVNRLNNSKHWCKEHLYGFHFY